MTKLFFCLTTVIAFLFLIVPTAKAVTTYTHYAIGRDITCRLDNGQPITDSAGNIVRCDTGLVCLPNTNPVFPGKWTCQPGSSTSDVFGSINPPKAILNLGFGSQGISQVLTTFVQLIYIIAGLIFIFMIVIGAVQWITSGGQKEGIENAQKRITHAIIGIVILSIAFVLIYAIGQITGFQFF